jgi:hypothetical protein
MSNIQRVVSANGVTQGLMVARSKSPAEMRHFVFLAVAAVVAVEASFTRIR